MSGSIIKRRTAPLLHFSLRNWLSVLWKTALEFNEDDVPGIAGGVTFFILLAFFPALTVFVSLYGLFANVQTARAHLSALRGLLPSSTLTFVGDEMIRIADGHTASLSFALIGGLLFSIWSANSGMKSMMAALNISYEEKERRSFVRLNLISLTFTLSALLLALMGLGAVVALPALIAYLGLAKMGLLAALRWPILLGGALLGLALIYRFGPNLTNPQWHWITPGSLFASLAWIGESYLLSWYIGNFAHYDRTYGSLGAVVGFLMWIWVGVMVVLIGAELNCELDIASGVRQRRLPEPDGNASGKERAILARKQFGASSRSSTVRTRS